MPYIISASHCNLPFMLGQDQVMDFSRSLFEDAYPDIDRLLRVFQNGEIGTRYFSKPLEWYKEEHSFEERNAAYIELAVQFGKEAVENCLSNPAFLKKNLDLSDVEAFFFISSTGIAAPSIEARIMNELKADPHIKRIPLWGLGCAGGAGGLSRAFDYCLAHPEAKVLVLAVELCSLTFQKDDLSKSNLVGSSLFADGASCVLVCGANADRKTLSVQETQYKIIHTQSTLLPDSEDVMGWDVKDGLYVVFSRDIPSLVKNWLAPVAEEFLSAEDVEKKDITEFIAHPGGKKVIQAYQKAFGFAEEMTEVSMDILRRYGNMSSPTILYVLEEFMKKEESIEGYALAAALGPGFSSEMLLMRREA